MPPSQKDVYLDKVISKRLAHDFFEAEDLAEYNPSSFFMSSAARGAISDFFINLFLHRFVREGDAEILSFASDTSKDMIAIIASILSSDEYFSESAGLNTHFFLERMSGYFPFCREYPIPSELDLAEASGRVSFLTKMLNTPTARKWLTSTLYNAVGIGTSRCKLEDSILGQADGFLENVWICATTEPGYILDAANGKTTREICRQRLADSLRKVGDRQCTREKSEIESISHAAVYSASPSTTFARIRSLLVRLLDRNRCVELFDLPIAAECLPGVQALSIRRLRHPGIYPDNELERDSRGADRELAIRIATAWVGLFLQIDRSLWSDVTNKWADRLIENDSILDVFIFFLLSSENIGINVNVLRALPLITSPPGCHIGLQARGANLDRIVATSFFYWYDSIDGKSLIACPDTMTNEEGADSLTVAPATRDNFSYQSLEWHRTQLVDMVRSSINVVLPVSYLHPFSCADPKSGAPGAADRLRFANAGLRAFRGAWTDLEAAGHTLPLVGLFYDTSTLNSDNHFRLKVDFRKKYGKMWFYESIRDFFSYLPQRMWARFEGRPIVFVYHPCFGDWLDDSLYDFVRACFQRDFGTDLYIVTASEEEAPRVLQPNRLTNDADALLERSSAEVLIDIITRDELYLSMRGDDNEYANTVLRRTVGSVMSGEMAYRRFYHGSLTSASARRAFIERIIYSADFRWAYLNYWFEILLRKKIEMRDPVCSALVLEAEHELLKGDLMEALNIFACSDAFFEAAGGTPDYFVDWLYQSIVWKHPNTLCTPNYGCVYSDGTGKQELLALLLQHPRRDAVRTFLKRYEVREAIVSLWHFQYYGWFNPGRADSSFYWSGAISPTIRGVASIGPGYDQHKLRARPTLFMPRQDGKTYELVWEWILAMKPAPKIVHIETWNEFFEGTPICDCEEFGDQYINLTRKFAQRFLA